MLELALAEGEVQPPQLLLHWALWLLGQFDVFWSRGSILEQGGLPLLCWGGELEGMAVFGDYALLLVPVDGSVELGLEGADLRQFGLWHPLAEEQLVAVDVEEGKALAHVLLVGAAVDLFELSQVLALAQLQKILHLLALLPLLLEYHLLLAEGSRANSFLECRAEHVESDDLPAGLKCWLGEGEDLLVLLALLLLLDEGQHELELAELLLGVVVQVPVEGQGLLEVDHPLALAVEIVEGGLLPRGDAEELSHLPDHVDGIVVLLPDVLLFIHEWLVAVVDDH